MLFGKTVKTYRLFSSSFRHERVGGHVQNNWTLLLSFGSQLFHATAQ